MGFDIYVQLKCPACGEVRGNPLAHPGSHTYEPQVFRNLINAVGIERCTRCAASGGMNPADIENLKAIRRAVNRTAYHGGLGLRDSGRCLATIDKLLAVFGVDPDDGHERDPDQSIRMRPVLPDLDPFGEITAAAIDAVLARLEEHGGAPTMRVPVTVPVIDEGDGPPVGSALVSRDRATITMAVDIPPDPDGRRPIEVSVGCVSVGYALRAEAAAPITAPPFEPVPDQRLREIAAGEYGPNRQEGKAAAAELISARNALRYHEAHGRMRTNILNGEEACIGCGKTAVLARHDGGDPPWLCSDCERDRERCVSVGPR